MDLVRRDEPANKQLSREGISFNACYNAQQVHL